MSLLPSLTGPSDFEKKMSVIPNGNRLGIRVYYLLLIHYHPVHTERIEGSRDHHGRQMTLLLTEGAGKTKLRYVKQIMATADK
jgi:hypothetical protein